MPELNCYKVPEWGSILVKDAFLTPRDRVLVDKLASGAGNRLLVEDLRSGIRISASSWVGVVRFQEFEVSIVPKLAGENLGLIQMLDYINDLGLLRRTSGSRTMSIQGYNLFDLLALLFAEAVERLVAGGLLSDYVSQEGDLPAVRGRILADRQILHRFGRVDRVECRYDERKTDILENQIIACALSVALRHVGNEPVWLKLRRLKLVFDSICSIAHLDLNLAQQSIVYHRLNDIYRESHELAWLLFEALGIKDVFHSGETRCFAFLLDMNYLFERFVLQWVRDLLKGKPVRITPQARHRSIIWNVSTGRDYAAVVPDLMLKTQEPPAKKLAVDAKYKKYDDRKFSSGDIFQLFLYAYAFQKERGGVLPASLLIYPSSDPDKVPEELQIKNISGVAGARINILGLHIPTALQEAKTKSFGQKASIIGDLLKLGKRAAYENSF